MTRFLGLLLMCCLLALEIPTASGQEPESARPNILIIVTDDQRAGLEVMPATRRWFQRHGTTYRPGFATTPMCCPARASIMTGRYAHNHGVKSNGRGGSEPGEPGLEALDHSTTIQAYLDAAGYRTGLMGRFLNGWNREDTPPHFDTWATFGSPEWYDVLFNINGTLRRTRGYITKVLQRRALRFIRSESPEPWYLYVAPRAPHLPAIPETRYADLRLKSWDGNPAVAERDLSDKPPYVQEGTTTLRRGRRIRRRQFRSLPSVDDLVASVFAELRARGELGNTLAFLISDNGFLWGEHRLLRKGVPYRQAVEVTFLATWRGHLSKDVVDRRFAANIDIAPTVYDAANITPSTPVDGRSLLQAWRRDRILLEHWCNQKALSRFCNRWGSIRTRTEQYVEYVRDGEVPYPEYYDMKADRWQLTNLLGNRSSSDDPDTSTLEAQLQMDWSCEGADCP
jgi:arylsulfatase A-like enzyme